MNTRCSSYTISRTLSNILKDVYLECTTRIFVAQRVEFMERSISMVYRVIYLKSLFPRPKHQKTNIFIKHEQLLQIILQNGRKQNCIFQLFSSETFSFISAKYKIKKGGKIGCSDINFSFESLSAAAQKPGVYKRKAEKERLLESVQVPASQL